jgi:hypothetical protein
MKIVLQNAVKYNGKIHRTGTVLDLPDAAAMSLIDRGAAEQAFEIIEVTTKSGSADGQTSGDEGGGTGETTGTTDGQPAEGGEGEGEAVVTAAGQSADAIDGVSPTTGTGSRKKS